MAEVFQRDGCRTWTNFFWSGSVLILVSIFQIWCAYTVFAKLVLFVLFSPTCLVYQIWTSSNFENSLVKPVVRVMFYMSDYLCFFHFTSCICETDIILEVRKVCNTFTWKLVNETRWRLYSICSGMVCKLCFSIMCGTSDKKWHV